MRGFHKEVAFLVGVKELHEGKKDPLRAIKGKNNSYLGKTNHNGSRVRGEYMAEKYHHICLVLVLYLDACGGSLKSSPCVTGMERYPLGRDPRSAETEPSTQPPKPPTAGFRAAWVSQWRGTACTSMWKNQGALRTSAPQPGLNQPLAGASPRLSQHWDDISAGLSNPSVCLSLLRQTCPSCISTRVS